MLDLGAGQILCFVCKPEQVGLVLQSVGLASDVQQQQHQMQQMHSRAGSCEAFDLTQDDWCAASTINTVGDGASSDLSLHTDDKSASTISWVDPDGNSHLDSSNSGPELSQVVGPSAEEPDVKSQVVKPSAGDWSAYQAEATGEIVGGSVREKHPRLVVYPSAEVKDQRCTARPPGAAECQVVTPSATQWKGLSPEEACKPPPAASSNVMGSVREKHPRLVVIPSAEAKDQRCTARPPGAAESQVVTPSATQWNGLSSEEACKPPPAASSHVTGSVREKHPRLVVIPSAEDNNEHDLACGRVVYPSAGPNEQSCTARPPGLCAGQCCMRISGDCAIDSTAPAACAEHGAFEHSRPTSEVVICESQVVTPSATQWNGLSLEREAVTRKEVEVLGGSFHDPG